MAAKPRRRAPWRRRRLTRREEEASVRLLFIVPALLVALLAPLSRCSPPDTVADLIAPATVTEAVDRPLDGIAGAAAG